MKQKIRDYAILIITGLIIVILDQYTKNLVRQYLDYSQIWYPFGWEWLYPHVYVVHWYNKGAAFGMFQDGSMVFTILAIIISILIIVYFPRIAKEDWPLRLALGLQLGGAVGNLIDRITVGHVTDFIAVEEFPVFNIADASITMGVVVLIIGMWINEKEKEKAAGLEQELDE